MNGIKPPSDIEIEKTILGLCLESRSNYEDLTRVIQNDPSQVFFSPNNASIMQSMQNLARSNEAFDLNTLRIELTKSKRWQDSMQDEILDFYQVAIASRGASIEMLAMHLMELHIKRSIIAVCDKAIRMSYDGSTPAQEALSQLQSDIGSVDSPIVKNTMRSIADLYDDWMEKLETQQKAIQEGEKFVVGQTTGLTVVDYHTGGDKEGELIIIAARPGEGKSTYVLNAARAAAKEGDAQGILSLEMDDYMQVGRIAANEGSIPNNRIQQAKLTTEDWAQLAAIRQRMKEMDIYLEYVPSLHIQTLESKIRFLVREKGVKRVFVDYLQLMDAPTESSRRGGFNDQNAKVSAITKRLKQLAGELGIPIVLLSQMSRDIEKRPGEKIPMLSDLRDSGSIEQDANTVGFLYSPFSYEDKFKGYCTRYYPAFDMESRDDVAELKRLTFFIIAKQRNGQVMSVPFWNDRKYMRMSDIRSRGMYKKTNSFMFVENETELLKRLGIEKIGEQTSIIGDETTTEDDDFPF